MTFQLKKERIKNLEATTEQKSQTEAAIEKFQWNEKVERFFKMPKCQDPSTDHYLPHTCWFLFGLLVN